MWSLKPCHKASSLGVSFKEAVKLTVKVSNGNVENERRKIRIWFIYVFSLSIKKVTMRRKKKSRKWDGETQLGFASTGESYYLEFSNLKMLSVLLDSKNDDFQTKFQLSLSESWWTFSDSWFSALVRGGGGIGETNLLRKAKTTTTTTTTTKTARRGRTKLCSSGVVQFLW